MDKYYFSFFDIPELIVRHTFTRQDYEKVLRVLQKVKHCFLQTKIEKSIARLHQESADRRRTYEESEEQVQISKQKEEQLAASI